VSPIRVVGAVALCSLLAACGDDRQELVAWMAQQRSATPVTIEPIQPPKPFEPFRFSGDDKADPFAFSNLSLKGAADGRAGGPGPNLNRRKDVLESFPLESVRMVGRITKRDGDFALLQVDRTIYRARVGDHLGENHGRIVRITDRDVQLKEIVQDAAGEWVERETVLQLQEGGK
jgi:type IV pilus assembly protein PilP